MRATRLGASGGLLVVLVTLAGACSSGSSSSSNGDKTAFCATNAQINTDTNGATSGAQVAVVLKNDQAKLDSFIKNAPPEVKTDAQTLVDAARAAIQKGDATAFATDTKVQQAGQHVDTFCGTNSTSSSSSSTSSSSSSSSSASDTSTPALVACDLFDLTALGAQTNLTWTVADRSKNDSCVITADNGNTVAIALAPTQGQNDAALSGAQAACDSGTFTAQNVVDGGYVCQVSGVASAGALFKADNVLVAASAVTFNGATTQEIQTALVDVLKSFVAPNTGSSAN